MKNRLVAHRGDMETYPENTLLALTKAAELNFSFIELDIQFSKDITPVVIHDDSLVRTTGIDKSVYASDVKELLSYNALTAFNNDESSKLLIHISPLEKVVEVLNKYSNLTLFVEIKRQCLEHFDIDMVIDRVLESLKYAKIEIVIISFVKEIIEAVKLKNKYATGWVLSKYDQVNHAIAEDIQPDFLFCNVKKVNQPSDLWKGPWKWVLYDIKNPSFAYELLEQGVDLIETGDIVKLNNSEFFANG
ncbi:MAG: glycerophosphodiester phosphodiesterase family protein [Pseudomonadota bacterium]